MIGTPCYMRSYYSESCMGTLQVRVRSAMSLEQYKEARRVVFQGCCQAKAFSHGVHIAAMCMHTGA